MRMTELQFRLIKENLRLLTSKPCFYKEKLQDIDIESIKTQEDFEKLPFTWKGDLREAYPLGLQAVPDEEIVRIHSSSGTTGTPIIIPYTQKDVDDWAKMFARCYKTFKKDAKSCVIRVPSATIRQLREIYSLCFFKSQRRRRILRKTFLPRRGKS